MTVIEAAARLEVKRATIYEMIAAGKLRCTRVGAKGGAIRISEEHIRAFLEAAEGRGGGVPAPAAPAPPPKLRHLRLS